MYQALYRCRLCGKKLFGENAYEDECEAIARITVPNGMYKIHHCTNGSLGNADFLGFEWRVKDDDKLDEMFLNNGGLLGFRCKKCGTLHILDEGTVYESKDRMFPCNGNCGRFVVATYSNAVRVDKYGREVKNAE